MRNNWQRADAYLDFSKAQLDEFIAPAFPGSYVVEWQQSEGGLANTNIRLRLNNREQPVLLRVFVRDPKQADKEWKINRLVHERVPSPEFYYFAATSPFTSNPYILMEWIDGIRLESAILELDRKDGDALGRSVGGALAAIHNHKFKHGGFFDDELNVADPIDLGGAGLIAYAHGTLRDGHAEERLGSSLAKRLLEFLSAQAHLLDEWRGQPGLTHADFGGSNILVAKDSGGWKVVAVLDWEFAFSGTPFFDFGNLLRAPHGAVAGFEQAVCDGYKSCGAELPDRWRQMSLLTDLTAWLEFMTRKNPGENLIADARRIIAQTIDNW